MLTEQLGIDTENIINSIHNPNSGTKPRLKLIFLCCIYLTDIGRL